MNKRALSHWPDLAILALVAALGAASCGSDDGGARDAGPADALDGALTPDAIADAARDATADGGPGPDAGDAEDGGALDAGPRVTMTVGPEGGTLTSVDDALRVEIPAGAVTDDLEIWVEPTFDVPYGNVGSAYELGPVGATFEQPVTIRMSYDPTELPAGSSEDSLQLAILVNHQRWEALPGAGIDPSRNEAWFEQGHFSIYGLKLKPFVAELSGPTEAAGRGIFVVDPTLGVVSYHVLFGGLSGDETGAWLRGSNEVELATFASGSPKVGQLVLEASALEDFLAGRVVVEIASKEHEDGELSGAILPSADSAPPTGVRFGPWDPLEGPPPVSAPPAEVDALELTVTGPGIPDAIEGSWPATVDAVELSIPAGPRRRLDVVGRDDQGGAVFRGWAALDLTGFAESVSVPMVSTVDVAPPQFGGVTSATRATFESVELGWLAGTDDHTDPAQLRYAIYVATAPGAQDFGQPHAVTTPGATSWTVEGLEGGHDYAFVVRAIDLAGHEDPNTVEVSASTFSTGQGVYVDARRGRDDPGCGTPKRPCRSVTSGLGRAVSGEPIYIGPGRYDEASGERFPLTPPDGAKLFGTISFQATRPKAAVVVPISLVHSSSISVPLVRPGSDVALVGLHLRHACRLGRGCAMTVEYPGDGFFMWRSILDGGENGRNGVFLLGGGKGARFVDVVVRGFQAAITSYFEDLEIRSSAFVDNGTHVSSWGDRGRIVANRFGKGSDGVKIKGSGRVVGNRMEGMQDALSVIQCPDARILHNAIVDNSVGVSVSAGDPCPGSPPLVMGNAILFNHVGLSFHARAEAAVHGNRIGCGDVGFVGSLCCERDPDLTDNSWNHDPPVVIELVPDVGCPGQPDVCFDPLYPGRPDTAPSRPAVRCPTVIYGPTY